MTARAGYATTLAAFVAVGSALVLGAHSLLAVIAGAISSSSVGAQWRAALAFAAALPFFAGIACARGLIESPRWLFATNKHVQLRTQTRQEAARTFNGTGTPGANRVTSILDDTLRNCGDGSKPAVPAPGQACRATVGGVNLCSMGFMFLVAFGLYGITSLIRLEFASDGRNAAAPFRRRLSLSYSDSEPCPSLDYGIAFAGLAFDVLFVLIARHVVDVMGIVTCVGIRFHAIDERVVAENECLENIGHSLVDITQVVTHASLDSRPSLAADSYSYVFPSTSPGPKELVSILLSQ